MNARTSSVVSAGRVTTSSAIDASVQRRSGRRLGGAIAPTPHDMIPHHPRRLHERVDDRAPHELERVVPRPGAALHLCLKMKFSTTRVAFSRGLLLACQMF